MRFCVSSTLKRNPLSKRLKKSKRDVKMAFSTIKNHEKAIQTHLGVGTLLHS